MRRKIERPIEFEREEPLNGCLPPVKGAVPHRTTGRVLKRKKSNRPMAGRKNKEGREKAIEDHREVSQKCLYLGIIIVLFIKHLT